MHFHFCGDIIHDVVHNLVILLNMAPDWVPLMAHMKGWLKEKSHGRIVQVGNDHTCLDDERSR